MPKTREQKIKIVSEGDKNILKSETLVVLDFTGLGVNKLNAFRKKMREAGAFFVVIKKRLFKLILDKAGINFDPKQLKGPTGVVFSSKNVYETSSLVYKSAKGENAFKILAGFGLKDKTVLAAEEIINLGKLPSREELLGQLFGVIASPVRMFLYILNEKAKRSQSNHQ